jgi:hypothetical protein
VDRGEDDLIPIRRFAGLTGILVRLLRDLDLPLSEVKELVTRGGNEQLRTLLAHHRERIVERHAELERILARIDVALDQGRGLLAYEIELVTLEPRWVVSRRARVRRPQLHEAHRFYDSPAQRPALRRGSEGSGNQEAAQRQKVSGPAV